MNKPNISENIQDIISDIDNKNFKASDFFKFSP